MEELLRQLVSGQEDIVRRLGGIENCMSGLEIQVQENTDLINALIHNVEVANAKIDGLALNTVSKEALSNLATKEDLNHLTAQIKVLSTHLFDQEVEIHKLKAVK